MYKHSRAIVITVSVLVAIFFTLVTYSYIKLSERVEVLNELRDIKGAVNTVNLALRNAALAPSDPDKVRELNIRFETRERVDNAIAKISRLTLSEDEHIIYTAMRMERSTAYRDLQNKLIDEIVRNASKDDLWPILMEYQSHQMLYIEHLDKLILSVVQHVSTMYKFLLQLIMGVIAILVVAANIHLARLHPQTYERRKCYLCKCDLPNKITLTLSKVLAEEEEPTPENNYPVRVCGTCYFSHISKLKI